MPYSAELQAFLHFVLVQYVTKGIDEIYQEKLGALIGLKYVSVNDATRALGSVDAIRDAFIGFSGHLFRTPDPSQTREAGKGRGTV